jgi:hypothetical protein
MSNSNTEYSFKFAFTSVTIRYWVDPSWTMERFVRDIKHQIYCDFDIRNDLLIEIVEAGQNTDQYSSEFAPAIQDSPNIPFESYLANRTSDDIAFYIRVKTHSNNVLTYEPQRRLQGH